MLIFLKRHLVEKKIRVNSVAPGPVWTLLNIADKPAEKAAEHGKADADGASSQPEEVAPAFVFFASEADSSYIAGEVLTLLGWRNYCCLREYLCPTIRALPDLPRTT